METDNTRFIKNSQISGSGEPQKVDIEEIRIETSLSDISSKTVPIVVSLPHGVTVQQDNIQGPQDENVLNEPVIVQEKINELQVTLRWSVR